MWSDSESKTDFLNFSEKAEEIADIVLSPELLPVSIGVFGDWGAGKSTILSLTELAIRQESKDSIHIKFDAWLYQGYDDAKASFLETISDHLLKEVGDNASLFEKAKNLLKRVNTLRLLGITADVGAGFFGVPTIGAFGRIAGAAQGAVDSEEVTLLDAAQDSKKDIQKIKKEGKKLLADKERKSPPKVIAEFRKEYAELINEIGKTIVVYVDNLDRCTPINAINTLEAIRLFVFLPNTAFIVAADEDMIRSAVREYHKGATERHQTDYLDKLLQVPVSVPKLGILEVRAYLFMLFASTADITNENLEKLRSSLERSLRNSWKDRPAEVVDLLKVISNDDTQKLKNLTSTLWSAERMAPILATSSRVNGNPRIVKRLLNVVKMRKKVADRREMNLEESLITKLVIFERCAGKPASIELYRLIDKAMGTPEIFKDLEGDENDGIKMPESWKGSEEFIKDWAKLEPALAGVDLRAAAYLSRDTVPLGIISEVLSPSGEALVQGLLKTQSISGGQVVKTLLRDAPAEEYPSVMDILIAHLRKNSDWVKKPDGVTGAQLLAKESPECKVVLRTFLVGLPKQLWIEPIIKELSK